VIFFDNGLGHARPSIAFPKSLNTGLNMTPIHVEGDEPCPHCAFIGRLDEFLEKEAGELELQQVIEALITMVAAAIAKLDGPAERSNARHVAFQYCRERIKDFRKQMEELERQGAAHH
jgi:hypothetical protein